MEPILFGGELREGVSTPSLNSCRVQGSLDPWRVQGQRPWPYYALDGGGVLSIAPFIGMKYTPMSRREWILPSASLV